MTLIFMVITPLQSAVMGTGEVLLKEATTIISTSDFLDLSSQAPRFDPAILNQGYAITWLNQPYPPFTTSEYALKPFQPEGSPATLKAAANWTGTTTKYWTELDCWEAEVTKNPVKHSALTSFYNGKNCNATGIVAHREMPGTSPYMMRYIGYQNSAWSDYWLAGPNCSAEASNQFLATWGTYDHSLNQSQLTGAYCSTSYFKQQVKVSITAKGLSPINETIESLGPPEPFLSSDFNISALEYLMQAGVASTFHIPRDYPFTHLVEHYPRLNHTGLAFPLAPMIGFALGGKNYTVPQYSDYELMGEAFRGAHKLVFSLAIQHMFVNASNANSTDGYVSFARYGVIVSRPFSAVVEGFLLLVAILAILLSWTCHQSASMLYADPGSLESLIDLIQDSDSILDKFSGKGDMNDEKLASLLGNFRFQLVCGCQEETGSSMIKVLAGSGDDENLVNSGIGSRQSLTRQIGHYSPIKPIPLRKAVGIFFTACLCAAIVVIIYLKEQEKTLGGEDFQSSGFIQRLTMAGLIRPSSSFEVNLILTSFIPTAFSTLVEPFWVLLNRLICILQPFQDLRSKTRNADQSLKARYTAVPPQLALIRAVKSGHILLAMVCCVALLANVLSVGLGGLFNESSKGIIYPLTVITTKAAKISDHGLHEFFSIIFFGQSALYEDPFYVANANITSGSPLVPWTTKEYFFLPVDLTSDARLEANHYNATTTGIGIAPSCVAIGPIVTTDEPPILDAAFGQPIRRPSACLQRYTPSSLFLNNTWSAIPQGLSAAEVTDVTTDLNDPIECGGSFIFGWSRSNITSRTGEMHTSFVVCRPEPKIATFQVSFDAAGRILASEPKSEFRSTLEYPNATTQFDILTESLHQRLRDRQLPWHNDSVSYEPLNYLFKIYSGNDTILDPAAPVPDPNLMLPVVSEVYKMTFALFLGLNMYVFEDSEIPEKVIGNQTVTETRIFLDSSAFIISLTVLSLNILTAISIYGWSIKFFLPRMPTTIASLVAYVASSRAVREYSPGGIARNRTFGFGRYVGDDGRAHIGIEFSERVIPVKVSSLERGNTMPARSFLGRLWHRSRGKTQGDTWL